MSQPAETPTAHPRVCPLLIYVGAAGGPVLEPDAGHRCALADVDAPPRRDVQARYCLGGRYALCPAFAAQAAAMAIAPAPPPRGLRALALLTMAALLLAAGSLLWHGQRRFLEALAAAAVSTAQATASVMATPSPPAPSIAPRGVPTFEPTAAVEATAEISFVALQPASTPPPTPQAARPIASREVERSRELRSPHSATTRPPDRIVATSIGLDAPVVPVRSRLVEENGEVTEVWEVADYAAGWHEGSALPGQLGNIVLSGHHNIKGQVFRQVERLKPGDLVVLYADGRAFHYVVQLKMIVKEKGEPPEVRRENARWIGPFPDERLTLVTCWPYASNTHRVIVVARPASASAPADRPIPLAVGPAD